MFGLLFYVVLYLVCDVLMVYVQIDGGMVYGSVVSLIEMWCIMLIQIEVFNWMCD